MSSKVSTTGYIVAAALEKLARLPEWKKYFTEEMILLNAAFTRYTRDSLVKYCISLEPPRLAIWLMDRLYIPGLMQHYLFRKRFIEQRTINAIAAGAVQIINLGAGFDTLNLRLAKAYPEVQFFEIDLPHTQAAKGRTLQHIHYSVPPNVTFIPVDLARTKLGFVFSTEKKLTSESSTCLIMEGVLVFLSESEVKALFLDLHRLFQCPVTVIFSARAVANGRSNRSRGMIDLMLKKNSEEIKWHCPGRSMKSFISELGYVLKEQITYKELQRLYRNESEIRNVPDEDENCYVVQKLQ